ncbi:hypothetical protein HYS90_02440 [Candidatus Curtissbacteria bacterium]|nr:hypothetical protein [Candidatus Curtissbacteria bacterium]
MSVIQIWKDEAKLFWKWLHDIIGRSKTRSFGALFKKLPEKLARFVDGLYLINISPAFGEKEALTAEIAKIAKRIKQKSIRGQLAQMSQRLKEAQKKSDKLEIATLIKKFNQLSTYLKEAI